MSLLYSPSIKYADGGMRKNHPAEFMVDSNMYHQRQQEVEQQNQNNSGLMRFRSAPSSLLASLVDCSSNGGDGDRWMCNDQMVFQADQQVQALPDHNPVDAAGTTLDRSFSFVNSLGLENSMKVKMGAPGNRSIPLRQSSSPPELFAELTMDNGFGVMRNVGGFRGCNGEASPSMSKMNDDLSFSGGPSPCSSHMTPIAEIGNELSRPPEDQSLGNAADSHQHYLPNFTNDSWNGSAFSGLRITRDSEVKVFPTSTSLESMDTRNPEPRNRTHGLTHHLSLPKTSIEMATIEKFLQFQGSVPCKIRAKRGFATHPRSIAERVRRTRISERMRKLQELFPNLDKQTNTADMLDSAVEFIKDLQKQVKTLADTKAKCTCSRKLKQYSNHSD